MLAILKPFYTKSATCKKTYIFNKTETFDGVIFEEGESYLLDDYHKKEFKLMSVYNDKQEAHVGMSLETFNEYFEYTAT